MIVAALLGPLAAGVGYVALTWPRSGDARVDLGGGISGVLAGTTHVWFIDTGAGMILIDAGSDPSGVDYPIPGNDDASRAIAMYCDLAARSVIDGMATQLGAAGFDLGELDEVPLEEALDEAEGSAEAAEPEPEAARA